MDCKDNLISKVENFGLTFNREKNLNNNFFCNHFTTENNLSIDQTCQLATEANSLLQQNCENKKNCKISIDYFLINQKCDFFSKTNLENLGNFYFSYSCYSKKFLKNFLKNFLKIS